MADHYAAEGVPFIVAGWQKRRRSPGDEASKLRKLHVTFIQPKKVLPDAPLYDPAVVMRPQPTAAALPNAAVVQQGYMVALEDGDS